MYRASVFYVTRSGLFARRCSCLLFCFGTRSALEGCAIRDFCLRRHSSWSIGMLRFMPLNLVRHSVWSSGEERFAPLCFLRYAVRSSNEARFLRICLIRLSIQSSADARFGLLFLHLHTVLSSGEETFVPLSFSALCLGERRGQVRSSLTSSALGML